MTTQQKYRIARLRSIGMSYAAIAAELGLSVNTIKSHCRRQRAAGGNGRCDGGTGVCPVCTAPLIHTLGAKKKRFCSDACRMAWWKANPGAVNRQAFYHFFCETCNAPFESYGNANRKFCSRACSGASRVRRSHE